MTTKATATKTTRAKKPGVQMTEDGQYPVYDAGASRDVYKKGDILLFPKVRNWADKGTLVEAFGRIVNTGLFEEEVPFIEVSFDDVKKLNKVDLGKDIRKFLLESKG
jgi:hypothetical protein